MLAFCCHGRFKCISLQLLIKTYSWKCTQKHTFSKLKLPIVSILTLECLNSLWPNVKYPRVDHLSVDTPEAEGEVWECGLMNAANYWTLMSLPHGWPLTHSGPPHWRASRTLTCAHFCANRPKATYNPFSWIRVTWSFTTTQITLRTGHLRHDPK